MENKYLLPQHFCVKNAYQTKNGEVKFKLKDVKYFAETYCNVDLTLFERWVVEDKMWYLYRLGTSFNNLGIPKYEYSDKPKPISLFN